MVSLLVLVTGMFMSVLYVSIVKRNAARASSLDDALRYMTFQQVQAQAFVTALDDLMMVIAVLTAVGVVPAGVWSESGEALSFLSGRRASAVLRRSRGCAGNRVILPLPMNHGSLLNRGSFVGAMVTPARRGKPVGESALPHRRAGAAPGEGSSPRVAARLADARRRILGAARVVVAEQGFAAAQMAVVASVADVATGSVYRHFPSKASLFSEMLRGVCVRELDVVRAIAAKPGRSVADRIGDAVATFVDRALRGEGLAYAVIAEPMQTEVDQVRLEARAGLADAFARLIEEGIASGELVEQDAGVRGAAIVGAFLEGVVAPLAHRAEVTPDRDAISVEIARFCQAGVAGAHAHSSTAIDSRRDSTLTAVSSPSEPERGTA